MKFKSKIRVVGNSHGVLIPMVVMESENLRAGDEVEVEIRSGKRYCHRCSRDTCWIKSTISREDFSMDALGEVQKQIVTNALMGNCDVFIAKE